MKALVITIDEKRLDSFVQAHQGLRFEVIHGVNGREADPSLYILKKDWRAYGKRRMSLGELGCALSHAMAWKRCVEMQEPVLILEDDARKSSDWLNIGDAASQYDVLFRGHRHIEDPVSIDDDYDKPTKWVNAHAYVINPKAASWLLEKFKEGIYAVDDFICDVLPKSPLSYASTKKEHYVQVPRSEIQTSTEPLLPSEYIVNFKTHVITVGTEKQKALPLMRSAIMNDINIINIGEGVDWKGGTMDGPGGGQKINLIKNYIKDIDDNDLLMFLDGYDVFIADNLETIRERFLGFEARILFAAEDKLWPDDSIIDMWPASHTKYRFLNSGTFIGEVGELKKLFHDPISDHEDDQLYIQKKFLSGNFDIALDYECYVFQTSDEDVSFTNGGQLFNPHTGCYPCVYHGNGGKPSKDKLRQLQKQAPSFISLKSQDFSQHSDDVIEVDFLTKEECDKIISIAEAYGYWTSMDGDKFPAQEIRLRALGIWDYIERVWNERLNSICEKHWWPIEMYGLRDAFVMKYTMDTQKDLPLHTDASFITGSIKLNDAYEGADLYFPRQKFSTEGVGVGKCVLFPGSVTHPHQCKELKSGVKYSLTMWTKRHNGDT